MAKVNLYATNRGGGAARPGASSVSNGLANTVKSLTGTVEVGSADSADSTYAFFRIPSKARILGASRAWWDDLASTGSPTLDIGLRAVDGNITSDDDALNDGLDAATAGAGVSLIKDVANYGKQAWEYVSGQTSDPGGALDVVVTLKDAAVNVGGSLTLQLDFIID